MITDDGLLNLARECARRVVENEILAIRQAEAPTMHAFWDLCPEASELAGDDAELRDRLWNTVCMELEGVHINYLLRGETAKDGHRRRLRLERERARLQLEAAQRRYSELDSAYAALEED